MRNETQFGEAQSVPVVEADVLDRMNETRSLIAQRAYEIYQARAGSHGFDQDDWFKAEGELLPKIEIHYGVTEDAVRLTAQVPGFGAKDLEVAVAHRRVAVSGLHSDENPPLNGRRDDKKVMRIVELPFDVDPALARATLQGETLEIALPRSRETNRSSP